jgi:hypothetical protein
MIGWNQILYGAGLSAAAAVLLLLTRSRQPMLLLTGGLATGAGAAVWNAILRAANGSGFFVDAPLRFFPVSWQDTVSGVFAFAATTLAYGLGPLARQPARRVMMYSIYSILCGVAALLVDVYLY